MDLGLAGRVFLVTGGTSGLGLATAEALVAEGARVVVSSRRASVVAEVAARLGSSSCVGVAVDNADPSAAETLVLQAFSSFGRLDGALLSVGGPPPTSAAAASDEQWRDAFESVFLGAVRLTRTVAAALDNGGAIALVLSTSVRAPITGMAISNGLRPGLAMWAKSLADELGPAGVRVVSLAPGRIDTPRLRESGVPVEVEQVPLRRTGRPEEFGQVAAFVLSPAASYLTGIVVPVDGGLLRTL